MLTATTIEGETSPLKKANLHDLRVASDGKGVERFRGDEDVCNIIAILSEDVHTAYLHYSPNQDLKYFYCFEGECCQFFGIPNPRYVIPIVQYQAYSPDNYGGEAQVKYLSIAASHYEMNLKPVIDKLRGEDREPTAVDLHVRVEMDAQFPYLTFEPLPVDQPKWKADPDLTKGIGEQVQRYDDFIQPSLARIVTREKFLAVIGAEDQSAGTGIEEVDDAFQDLLKDQQRPETDNE